MQDLEISPNIFYTAGEAASLLRVSPKSIRKLLKAGVARGIKIGRSWRVLGNDLLQLPSPDEMTDSELTRSMMKLSEPLLREVWDNEEDSIYDEV